MEITEVRIKLMEDAGERLQGFCSITFDDCFVVRDLKIIGGTTGPFVAMPSRKLTAHCARCGSKNHLRAAFCNQCGAEIKDDRAIKDDEGRAKLYADIAHPINSACREMIQDRVIQAFRGELERAKLPGYVSSYDDFDEDVAPSRTPVARRTDAGTSPMRSTSTREQSSREATQRSSQARPGSSSPAVHAKPGDRPRHEKPAPREAVAPRMAEKPAIEAPTAQTPPTERTPTDKLAAEKSATEKSATEKANLERTIVQPAEAEPRGPHRASTPTRAPTPPNKRDNFGAGIL